jgi:hypothetical protein
VGPPQRYCGLDHLHYLTTSTYRHARVFDSHPFKLQFVRTLDELRSHLGFRILGYVPMPEQRHSYGERAYPSPGPLRLMKAPPAGHPLSQRERARNQEKTALSLWERGDRKAVGEGQLRSVASANSLLNTMRSSVVAQPGEWPWSSWRFYCLGTARFSRWTLCLEESHTSQNDVCATRGREHENTVGNCPFLLTCPHSLYQS